LVLLSRGVRSRGYAVGLAIAAIAPLGAAPLVGPVNPWADRYVFVGVFGGALCLGQLLTALFGKFRTSLPPWFMAPVILAGVAACWNVSRVWKNERTLWTYAVRVAPDSARAWSALSRVERLDGHLDAADELAAHALALNPMSIPARVTGVYNLLARGSLEAARREITYVDLLGGSLHPGMARARSCARMSREEASRCARAN
jgi:hypothetical protein